MTIFLKHYLSRYVIVSVFIFELSDFQFSSLISITFNLTDDISCEWEHIR